MNRTKIEYVTWTWNPVTGCRGHGERGPCRYCFARRIAQHYATKPAINHEVKLNDGLCEVVSGKMAFPMGFMPTFYRYRLNEPFQQSEVGRVFVCDMGDLFGEWVPDQWIQAVREASDMAYWHTYLWLTKNPARYGRYEWAKKDWLGYSSEGQRRDFPATPGAGVRWISFEPLLREPDTHALDDDISWIVIGAQTGPGAVTPNPDWVDLLLVAARRRHIPVFVKQNCPWPYAGERWQEFPEAQPLHVRGATQMVWREEG